MISIISIHQPSSVLREISDFPKTKVISPFLALWKMFSKDGLTLFICKDNIVVADQSSRYINLTIKSKQKSVHRTAGLCS